MTEDELAAMAPLDVMLHIMRHAVRIGSWSLALDAPKAAAPYQHRTLMPAIDVAKWPASRDVGVPPRAM